MATPKDNNRELSINEAVRQFVEAQLSGKEPDIEDFVSKYPEFEHQIRQKIKEFQKVDSLFDNLIHADESDFHAIATGLELVGKKIGSFKIEEIIGHGGMGIVYLARDTKLDRPVAIKSLPSGLLSSSTAKSRFKREAKLLASMNHPNIAVIYDIIEQDEDISYLVLEYVPGQSLAQRIAREPLKVEQTLLIAQQIALAVEAAHEKGVIHRDLKPSNIKLTPENKVKVLDFGLAKASISKEKNSDITVTQPGRVIGTPAYMSPEQIRGNTIDRPTDIWSFGCILYEMLTGKRPFEAETVSDTVAHTLEREPVWQDLPKETPVNIRILLRRCLEKDTKRRLRDIGDANIEIAETLNSPTVSLATVEKTRPLRMRRLMVVGLACLILVALATGVVMWSLIQPHPLSQPVRRYIIHPETNLSKEALWHRALALSPDGRRLAYVEDGSDARRKIYLRNLDEFEAKPLPGTEGAISPFFSPDGEWIGYVDHYEKKLKKVSVKGGQPIGLCETLNFRGGTWASDGTIIFTPFNREGLWRISTSGERLEKLTFPDPNKGERGHLWPQILPGGKAVLFTNLRRGFAENLIEIYWLETGKRHVLFKGGTCAQYIPTGHIVYVHKNALYAVRFDVEQLKVVGLSVSVVPDIMTSEGQSESAQFAISWNGSLAYVPVAMRSSKLMLVWVDRKGRIEPLSAAPRNYDIVAISPDGMRLAFDEGEKTDVWIYDLTLRTLTQLTSNGISDSPVWTADGRWLVFQSTQVRKYQLFRQNVTDNSKPELLATFEDFIVWPTSCSPDSKELLMSTMDRKNPIFDLYISVIPLEKQNGKSYLQPLIHRHNQQRFGKWSPDGRWVTYTSDESGRWEVYVEPYPGPGPKVMISREGGYSPRWSRDGKEIFYRGGYVSPKMIAAMIETEPEFRVIEYKELFETNLRLCDVAPDGRFLMIQEPQEPTPSRIHVVLNWFEELERLVPLPEAP